jgi:hypothetical protein
MKAVLKHANKVIKNIQESTESAFTATRRALEITSELEESFIKGSVKVGKVYQRHIFDFSEKNIKLMLAGKPPVGLDGKSVELHHLYQKADGDLIELTYTEHKVNHKALHPYV